jgi:hypothetical protein
VNWPPAELSDFFTVAPPIPGIECGEGRQIIDLLNLCIGWHAACLLTGAGVKQTSKAEFDDLRFRAIGIELKSHQEEFDQ